MVKQLAKYFTKLLASPFFALLKAYKIAVLSSPSDKMLHVNRRLKNTNKKYAYSNINVMFDKWILTSNLFNMSNTKEIYPMNEFLIC